jgi:hypothetical protein
MSRSHKTGTGPRKSRSHRKAQSPHDQEVQGRQRTAEHLVQQLREAGYVCGLTGGSHAQALKREN